jgi:hypothetical protein
MNAKDHISRLISARKSEGLEFDEAKLKEVFASIQSAKSGGYLGANRAKSCCLVPTVNAANEILRSKIDRSFLQRLTASPSDEIYIYISLVSLRCFKESIHSAA